jgi:hypothetical protein
MNERIQQLAEQATSIVEMVGPQGYTSSYANFDREKFAKLIIQECISKLDEEIYRSIDGDGDEAWHDLILKEHFGVCNERTN